MMKKRIWLVVALALTVMPAMTACTSSTRTTQTAGEYVDDATITSKVKGELLGDSGLASFDISVETYNNVVQLSGFVNSEQIKARAGQIAAGVSGVKGVRNDLVVK